MGRTDDAVDALEPASLSAKPTLEESPRTRPSRIKFRVKPPTLPLIHPQSVLPRPRRYSTLEEFFHHGANIPVDKGGLFHPEEASEYTPEQIAKDAQILLRAEEAVKPGGILSPEVSTVYQPEEPDEMPSQYAQRDHMNRAAIEFRKLMQFEQR